MKGLYNFKRNFLLLFANVISIENICSCNNCISCQYDALKRISIENGTETELFYDVEAMRKLETANGLSLTKSSTFRVFECNDKTLTTNFIFVLNSYAANKENHKPETKNEIKLLQKFDDNNTLYYIVIIPEGLKIDNSNTIALKKVDPKDNDKKFEFKIVNSNPNP